MNIKIGDSVIVKLENGKTTPAKVIATHIYPNDAMVVSVKGNEINNWIPRTNIQKVIK